MENRKKEKILNVHKDYYPNVLRLVRNNIVKIISESSPIFSCYRTQLRRFAWLRYYFLYLNFLLGGLYVFEVNYC
jgi:hypothetical protein